MGGLGAHALQPWSFQFRRYIRVKRQCMIDKIAKGYSLSDYLTRFWRLLLEFFEILIDLLQRHGLLKLLFWTCPKILWLLFQFFVWNTEFSIWKKKKNEQKVLHECNPCNKGTSPLCPWYSWTLQEHVLHTLSVHLRLRASPFQKRWPDYATG